MYWWSLFSFCCSMNTTSLGLSNIPLLAFKQRPNKSRLSVKHIYSVLMLIYISLFSFQKATRPVCDTVGEEDGPMESLQFLLLHDEYRKPRSVEHILVTLLTKAYWKQAFSQIFIPCIYAKLCISFLPLGCLNKQKINKQCKVTHAYFSIKVVMNSTSLERASLIRGQTKSDQIFVDGIV